MNRLATSLLVLLVAGCSSDDRTTRRVTFDFAEGPQGWIGGFADYPVGAEDAYELAADYRALPPSFGLRSALYLSGFNQSDDLFMYYKRRVTGLKADHAYQVRFLVEIATEAPSGCSGIGGAPGESVYVKAGGATEEPLAVANGDGFYEMNLDKGVQGNPGDQALLLGDISTGRPCGEGVGFELKSLASGADVLTVTSDGSGAAWLLVGTDSGYEGRTNLYYTRVDADFME